MITEVTLSNFRAYSDPVSIRFRPITVLIGRNSAGKSTLIKFLQMIRQSLASADDTFFVTEGQHVQLGAFRELKNKNCTKRSLDFTVRVSTDDVPPQEILSAWQGIRKGAVSREHQSNDRVRLVVELRRQELPNGLLEGRAEYEIEGCIQYSRTQPRGRHSVRMMMGRNMVFENKSNNLRRTRFLAFPFNNETPEEGFKTFLASRILDPIRQELISSRHLSAIREESERAIIVASPPSGDLGHKGEYAMPHLRRLLEENGDAARLVLKHTEDVAGVRDLRFDIAMKGYLGHVKGTNVETGAECHLADFGFGVSQCIPVFIQGALMNKGQLLMVEQPEAHLHPTAQLSVGSYFADLWKSRGVQSLIETHSANILLRLRRLVKEKALDPEDVSVAFFATKDGKVTVKNLDVHQDGSLEAGLPMEFFGADVIEAIEMGV